MRRVLVTLAAAPFLVAVLACGAFESGSSTSSEDGDGPADAANRAVTVKAGEPITLTETILGSRTVAVITLTNVRYGVESGDELIESVKGQFVTAEVAVEVKEGKYSINSGQFKLIAADGTAYDATSWLDSKDLAATDLAPGQKTSGTVVFDVALGAQTGGRIAVKSWLAEGDAGHWLL